MAQQQRYTPVPGFGLGNDDIANFDSHDSRYPTPQRLSGTSPTSLEMPRRGSSLALQSNPSTPYADPYANSAANSSAMPLMTEVSNSQRAFSNPDAHRPIPSEAYYPVSNDRPAPFLDPAAQQKSKQKKKMFVIGGIILAAVIIIAIVIGVVVSQVKKNDDNGKGSKDGKDGKNSSNKDGSVVIGDDPSNFKKDSNLHQSFWGFAYTPSAAQPPWCGVSLSNTTRDIQLLSQLTPRLRLYGANCNQTAMVLQAIQDTKVNMTVWLGIYIDSNDTAYKQQVDAVVDALKTYGADHVSGITVGNEYILNTAGSDSTTSSPYLASVNTIAQRIEEVKTTIQGLGLSKTLPIGTSDAGSVLSKTLATKIDYFMANVHPYFGSLAIDDAAAWTDDFFHKFDVDVAALAPNKPAAYIAETGWPSSSSNATDANSGAGSPQGDASVANLQTFLNTFVCQANTNGTEYFYFEAFDEPWKDAQFGGVEGHWGLFDSNRNLKDVKIPVC
ncbi:hypothetical protein L204_106311 [Cryptococcus depauperatus]